MSLPDLPLSAPRAPTSLFPKQAREERTEGQRAAPPGEGEAGRALCSLHLVHGEEAASMGKHEQNHQQEPQFLSQRKSQAHKDQCGPDPSHPCISHKEPPGWGGVRGSLMDSCIFPSPRGNEATSTPRYDWRQLGSWYSCPAPALRRSPLLRCQWGQVGNLDFCPRWAITRWCPLFEPEWCRGKPANQVR